MSTSWFMYHTGEDPFAFPVGPKELKLRLFVQGGLELSCMVLHGDRYDSPGLESPIKMTHRGSAGTHDIYEAIIYASEKRSRYLFYAENDKGQYQWFGERGASVNRDLAGSFQYAYMHHPEAIQLPSWVEHAIVYQIFPDSFSRGELDSSVQIKQQLSHSSMYGGTLQGIKEKIEYLRQLGVTVIYMTPVFHSPSNHKYNTTDYYEVDPSFGDTEMLKQLVETAHQHGIKVLLDAVFNHTGDTFFAFQDVMEKGVNSSYTDWYFIDHFPVTQLPVPNYETFGKSEAYMPKLNLYHPEAIDYMLDVAKYWIQEVGIDGWRLDVANEVNHEFWKKLRDTIKGLDPELLLIGEIMHSSGPWLRGDEFDGGMNYLFRDVVIDFFAKQSIGPVSFSEQIIRFESLYNDQANRAMFQLIGSHDTERFLTVCENGGRGWNRKESANARMMLAVFFQFTSLGIPMIYYGDEVGMRGGADPDCRRPMIWEETGWNATLNNWYRLLIRQRNSHASLRRGSFRFWFADEARNVLGYLRQDGEEIMGLLINLSPNSYTLELETYRNDKESLVDLLSGRVFPNAEKLKVTVDEYGCCMLL
ncbi:MAG: alpha amylase N-terminal ig-like domain-containing protein [Candidatus Pristimantibacillus sp.]